MFGYLWGDAVFVKDIDRFFGNSETFDASVRTFGAASDSEASPSARAGLERRKRRH